MKRLYRTKDNKMIAGVASGLADYFEIDVVLVRLLWVLAVLLGGTGVVAYIIAWIIIPERRDNTLSVTGEDDIEDKMITTDEEAHEKRHHLAGVILVVLGVFFLVRQFFPWNIFSYFWPVAIIALGVFLLIGNRKES